MLTAEIREIGIGRSDEVPDDSSALFSIEGRDVAVFRRSGQLFAIDDHCPHKKASLQTGSCGETSVTCPWHGWQFDLRTGESLDHPGFRVATHAIAERDGDLWLSLSEAAESNAEDSHSHSHEGGDETAGVAEWAEAYRSLIRYGAMAWAGYFRSTEKLEVRHGERVLIQTSRGVEVGEVLSTMSADPPRNDAGTIIKPSGELLRKLSPMETFEVVRRERDVRITSLVREVLDECGRRISERGIAVDIVDGELFFDGMTLVIYFLGPPTADLGRLATELGEGREFKVIFNSVIEQPPESSGGCGSGGCGSGGGGCGST